MTAPVQAFPFPRYSYRCLECRTVTVVVIPLRAGLFSEYQCDRCGKRTKHDVAYLPAKERPSGG